MTAPPTIAEVSRAIREKDRTAVEVVETTLQQIRAIDPGLGCFHEIYAERSLEAAAETDRRMGRGESPGPLAGVPIAIKDNIVTDFGRTTCGSKMLEHYESPYTATAVERLLDAGAIVIGKTRCDEFAMGSSGENSAFGPTRNPCDPSRVPGGSSSGSAAAVAAGLVPGALGSETGGSIRQPAALCGIVGVKPSYGRVSRWGLVAFGSSLDQVGPFGCCVHDTALLLGVMAGPDPRDSTSSPCDVPDYPGAIDEPIDGLRLGVPRQFLQDDNDPAVNDAVRSAVEVYRDLGAEILEIDLPLTEYGIATYYVISAAEASANLARYDGVRYGHRAEPVAGEDLSDMYARSRAEGFGDEVQRRIMLGTYVLSAGYHEAYYERAMQVRTLIRKEYDEAFEKCHALLGPTSPCTAFPLGQKSDPLQMYLCDLYTVNTNIAGICGISIPCGTAEVDGAKLPIGLQIQCRAFDETTMFRIARLYERTTGG